MEEQQTFAVRGMKALVVDDNEVNILVVSSMLEQFDIEIEEAYSGLEAIEKVKETDFDIIFMDYLMPKMNGIEATQQIRALGKARRPIIIALSANETQELKLQFESAGVDDVMSKPLDLTSVCETLKKWIKTEPLLETASLEEGDKLLVLREAFLRVEELDIDLGLSHLAGQIENYVKVLEASVGNIQAEIKRLTLLNASQTQVTSMKISFHSLKGVLVNIGAMRLYEQSHLLELAAGNQEDAFVKKGILVYIEALKEFSDKLMQGVLQYKGEYGKEEKETYIPLTKEEYQCYLEELKYCLSRYEFNDLADLMEHLFQGSKETERDKMEQIAKEIQNFRYEEALQLLLSLEE